jgi:hypothetical protein
VDVRVDRSRCGDQSFTADYRGAGTGDDVDPVQGGRVAGPANRGDAAAPDPDGGLPHAQHRVEDQHVRHDEVGRLAEADRREVHAVPGGLAEPEQEFVAAQLGVGLHADDQAGIAERDAVAGRGAVDGGVVLRGHRWSPAAVSR